MDAHAIEAMIDRVFPQARQLDWRIDRLGGGRCRLLLDVQEHHLRPGPSVAGPTLMALADTAMFFAVLSVVGEQTMAVTTDLNMHFMRRFASGTLAADAQLMKTGRRLCVGRVDIAPAAGGAPIAFATLTYALPPAQSTVA